MRIARLNLSLGPLLQGLGLLALIAGLVTWTSLLLQPSLDVVSQQPAEALAPSEAPAGRWFADLPLQVQIQVSGVMAGSQGAVAIVSIDGGPARAVRSGEELARGVHLVAIEGRGLVIERGGQRSRVEVPVLAQASFWGEAPRN
ncbi:general secretion pathway protein GspC [Pseudomonas sp. 250J]|uniref:General secretion pathway protein GspC n=1 Tax=Pseudomonas peradeniyensis TaxID=2745488 RepID=A0ABT2VAT5_9PSED|nr:MULTISPECIES: general secretion pathway protein GspC [Pseudomonas]KNX78143.1 general secretion pathway protein GspC [Pseudomonas sp. 250J]MCU7238817.1 general secretion pathway protein GspC [Pseudomonas peradeniyensis]MCU7278822.1 general secretion pathway protein GspC [Pseudomonas peradeniyensis]QZA52124.1 general secretion pathway protein GspC [Pseudomonas sp. 2hn]